MNVETLMSPERATVLHSWCVQAEWDAPTVVGGQGAYLHFADGPRILDMSSLAECSNLGHQHPAPGRRHPRAGRASVLRQQRLGRRQPRAHWPNACSNARGLKAAGCFSLSGGADANENAIKIARQAAGKPKARSSRAIARITAPPTWRWRCRATHARKLQVDAGSAWACATCRRRMRIAARSGARDDDECGRRAAARRGERIDAIGADGVAAVLMEPNAGTNGIVAPDTYWPALRRAPHARGVWLIADEVMSAFGRCGEWFAWQRHGEAGRPDMMTLAKGLTGRRGAARRGRPVSARSQRASSTRCSTPASRIAAIRSLARRVSRRSPPTKKTT